MVSRAKSIPEGFHTVTPYLAIKDARAFIEFTKQAFGATETSYHDLGGGHVHAEIKIGDSMIMVGQTEPLAAQIFLYVEDVDATYARAVKAGASSVEAPNDKPYGDRSGWVVDGHGITWFISTRKEDLTDAEIVKRMSARAAANR
jgi:PhnB protein